MPHGIAAACGLALEYGQRLALPASEGRTRSHPVEQTASNGHVGSMIISGSHKKYLVVSVSLLTRS
jgi:hypothetical protein